MNFLSRLESNNRACFIVFEAGPTHNGIESACKLADLAAESGADAIKFQMLDPDFLVADRNLPFSYSVLADRQTGRVEEVEEPLYDILARRVLSKDEWVKLKHHCDALGLIFFATAFQKSEVDFLADLGCDTIKIASGDINHFPLIRYTAKTGMSVQLDTGSATIGEVEAAVDVVRAEGNENIIINHCPSGYPARLESINLKTIETLKQMFPYPVAFSDHTPGWTMDIAAVALGADMIEKTITLDRTTRSAEHMFSLEPQDMKAFVREIRDLEKAIGTTRRILHPEERNKRKAIRRSMFVSAPVSQGDLVSDDNVEFRRPGFGITPDRYGDVKGARFAKDMDAGEMVSLRDIILED